jgi:hypothetical protein
LSSDLQGRVTRGMRGEGRSARAIRIPGRSPTEALDEGVSTVLELVAGPGFTGSHPFDRLNCQEGWTGQTVPGGR